MQVSYRKAVKALAPELGAERAEQLLAQALPAAQQDRLHARREQPAPHTRVP